MCLNILSPLRFSARLSLAEEDATVQLPARCTVPETGCDNQEGIKCEKLAHIGRNRREL